MILGIGSRQNKYGFTLVEVLLSMVILSVGLVGILCAYASMLNALGVSRDYIEEVCLSKEKMSEIEQEELEEEGIADGVIEGDVLGMSQSFKWQRDITLSDSKGLKIAKVTVFKKGSPAAREFSLVTYVYNQE